jgi:anti-sigma factor ChrR (cupin superfamily)
VTKAPFTANSTGELPADRALRVGAERLQRAVSELPLRYAPFFERLSGLWQLPVAQVQSELARAGEPSRWSPTLLSGMRLFDVQDNQQGARARLIHFAPGAHFPQHRHLGRERVLVLEGAYTDGSGLEVHAGDEQSTAEGVEHELRILGTSRCVVALSERGIAFTSPWLRWVNLLLR